MKKNIFKITSLIFVTLLLLSACGNGTESAETQKAETDAITVAEEHIHSFGAWNTVKKVTCIENGTKERVCLCGKKEVQVLNTIKHNYGEAKIIKKATCTSIGVSEEKCTVCGDSYTTNIAMTPHQYTEWKTISAGTCLKNGSRERSCVLCGTSFRENLKSAEHKYSTWKIVSEVTCDQDGIKERTCSVCGDKDTEITSSTGHIWKEATCTTAKMCNTCGDTQGDPLGHTVDSGICGRCHTMCNDPYQEALQALEEKYAGYYDILIEKEATIEARESMLRSQMRSLGVSYLSSSSYYQNRLNSIQTTMTDKRIQAMYARNSGDYAKANRLESEVAQLEYEYSECYQLISLAERQEEIDDLKWEVDMMKSSMEQSYRQELKELQEKYQR